MSQISRQQLKSLSQKKTNLEICKTEVFLNAKFAKNLCDSPLIQVDHEFQSNQTFENPKIKMQNCTFQQSQTER